MIFAQQLKRIYWLIAAVTIPFGPALSLSEADNALWQVSQLWFDWWGKSWAQSQDKTCSTFLSGSAVPILIWRPGASKGHYQTYCLSYKKAASKALKWQFVFIYCRTGSDFFPQRPGMLLRWKSVANEPVIAARRIIRLLQQAVPMLIVSRDIDYWLGSWSYFRKDGLSVWLAHIYEGFEHETYFPADSLLLFILRWLLSFGLFEKRAGSSSVSEELYAVVYYLSEKPSFGKWLV